MAVWQFKFSLVPSAGIVAIHGKMVGELRSYQPPASEDIDDDKDGASVDYWDSAGASPLNARELTALLPAHPSWSSDAEMFGSKRGDRIELWTDDINCILDMRAFSESLLESIVAIAARMKCKVVVHGTGEVVDPDVEQVMARVKQSGAYQFCKDPDEYFRQRRHH